MPVVSGTLYATRTDLANLGLVGAALTNVATATQDAALASASAIADSFFQSRYDLPIVNWGSDVVQRVAEIAAYSIMTSRGYNVMQTGADQQIRQRYLDALAWLQEVSQGKQTPAYLTDSSSASSSDGDGDDSVTTNTDGGLQLTTSRVRGWTDRGGETGSTEDGWRQ